MKIKNIIVFILLVSATISFSQSKYSLGISGGFVAPAGTMGDLYQSGFGGGLSFGYNLNHDMQLFLSVNYNTHKFNNDVFNDVLDYLGVTEKPSVDATLSVIPIMVGAKYFFSEGSFKPYGAVKIGLNMLSFKAVSVKLAGQQIPFMAEESSSSFGWGLALGFQTGIAKGVNLDVNANVNGNGTDFIKKFNIEKDANNYYREENKSTGLYFSILAGVSVEL